MSDDAAKLDPRLEFIKSRIISCFPKLVGSKLDKSLSSDEIRYEICYNLFISLLTVSFNVNDFLTETL